MPNAEGVHLVLGPTGQLGHELTRVLGRRRPVVAVGRPEVDLLRPETVVAALQKYRPLAIWNTAAATAVDALEDDPSLAFRVNAEAVGVMADAAKDLGAVLVHFSTDYVFDGKQSQPYSENDAPNPLNVYGASKLAGEQAIRRIGGRWFILRTSWLYGVRGRNFLRSIIHKGLTLDRIRVVDDQVGAPTEVSQLALACEVLCDQAIDRHQVDRLHGLYHVTASGSTSWYGFACAIRDELRLRDVPWKAIIDPISAVDLRLPALRPANSVLQTDRFVSVFGVHLLSWRDGLRTLPRGGEPWLESLTESSSARPT